MSKAVGIFCGSGAVSQVLLQPMSVHFPQFLELFAHFRDGLSYIFKSIQAAAAHRSLSVSCFERLADTAIDLNE